MYLNVEDMSKRTNEHSFSIELKSKSSLSQLVISNDSKTSVLIEGILGDFESMNFIEESMIEINGDKGILQMDLSKQDLKKMISTFHKMEMSQ